jgi:hypothetical protein
LKDLEYGSGYDPSWPKTPHRTTKVTRMTNDTRKIGWAGPKKKARE